MSNKYIGQRTVLKRGNGDGPPETFTAVAQVKSVDPPALKLNVIDSTTYKDAGTAADYFKDKTPGLIDAGQLKIQIEFDTGDTGHQGIIEDMVNRVLRNWQVQFPDGSTIFTFAAYVAEFQPKNPVENLVTADITLDVSGKPTFGSFA